MNGRPWTDRENRILRTRYPHEFTADIARDINRTVSAIYAQAKKLGLSKTPEHMAKPGCHRLDGKIGAATRFQKGHASWNKGKHYTAGGRSAETRFKKGRRPYTWAPIGTERVTTKDRYLVRRVSETGCQRVDWVPVHKLVWVEAHGEIPAGHVIAFRDGNKQNVSIENLECITRAENMRRNTIHNLPPELVDTIQARGRLNRRINRMLRDEKQD